VPVHVLDRDQHAPGPRALLTVTVPVPLPRARRLGAALAALAAGVALALLVGWAVLGWTSQLLLPVGVVVAAWAVGEVVRAVLGSDRPRE
jgi:hypothetical protein